MPFNHCVLRLTRANEGCRSLHSYILCSLHQNGMVTDVGALFISQQKQALLQLHPLSVGEEDANAGSNQEQLATSKNSQQQRVQVTPPRLTMFF